MSKKKGRFFITLLAVILCMTAFSSVAYAGGGPENEPSPTPTMASAPTPTSSLNSFTPYGTGTVLDSATDADGKEFYTILTPDEHMFYLVIDRQRNTENVYFLDVVTEKDLLALAEATKNDEPVTSTSKPEPTPEPTPQPEQKPGPQSNTGGIIAVLLIVAVIAIGVFCFFKFRKPTQSVKGKSDLDDYDFGEDELCNEDSDENIIAEQKDK